MAFSSGLGVTRVVALLFLSFAQPLRYVSGSACPAVAPRGRCHAMLIFLPRTIVDGNVQVFIVLIGVKLQLRARPVPSPNVPSGLLSGVQREKRLGPDH